MGNLKHTHFLFPILGPSTSDVPLLIAVTAAPMNMMSSNPVSQSQQLLVWDQYMAIELIKLTQKGWKRKGVTEFSTSHRGVLQRVSSRYVCMLLSSKLTCFHLFNLQDLRLKD